MTDELDEALEARLRHFLRGAAVARTMRTQSAQEGWMQRCMESAVRDIRRDAMKHLKELVDNGEVGADEEHRAEGRVDEITAEHTKQIDDLLKHKEDEVMEV